MKKFRRITNKNLKIYILLLKCICKSVYGKLKKK